MNPTTRCLKAGEARLCGDCARNPENQARLSSATISPTIGVGGRCSAFVQVLKPLAPRKPSEPVL
jgi:hypothetical protein